MPPNSATAASNQPQRRHLTPNAMKNSGILIIDDQILFRVCLKCALEKMAGYHVVGQAATGRQGLQLTAELGPDLILVDCNLPDMGGIALTRRIKALVPHSRVIIFGPAFKSECIRSASRVGAAGYFRKDCHLAVLLEGIVAVRNGQYFQNDQQAGAAGQRVFLFENF